MATKGKSLGKKPYIFIETDCSSVKEHELNNLEWAMLDELFQKHPALIAIRCPDRDPELMSGNSVTQK